MCEPGAGCEDHEGPDGGRGQIGGLEQDLRHQENTRNKGDDGADRAEKPTQEHSPGAEPLKERLAARNQLRVAGQGPEFVGSLLVALTDFVGEPIAEEGAADGSGPSLPEG